MVNKYHIAIVFLVLLIATSFSGCTGEGPEVTEEFNGEYEAGDDTVLRVTTVNGEIEINRWDGDTVVLNAIKKTRFGADEFEDVKIEVTEDDNEISIETKHLGGWGVESQLICFLKSRIMLRLTI